MAEEAIGLAKSLGWSVAWGVKDTQHEAESPQELLEHQLKEAKGRRLTHKPGYTIDGEKLYEGDTVYVDDVKGTYTRNGFKITIEESDSDFEFDEWTDEALRERIAMTCIQKVRKISPSHFFGKGKVQEIGQCIEEQHATIVFVNGSISPVQQRNLEETWNKLIASSGRKVSVIDRFGIILRIFSERAKTPQSKLQLELAWLKYIRARLVRNSSGTMGGLMSLFKAINQK